MGVFSLLSNTTLAIHSQCSDGLDNDHNGKTDYPQDDACSSLDEGYEGISTSGNFITITDGKETITMGGSVVYVITLKQQRETSRNVNVTLHLPHQSNMTSASDAGSVRQDTVTWTNISIYKDATRTITVNVNVTPEAKPGQYLVARALVEGAEATDTTLVAESVQPNGTTYDLSVSDGKNFIWPGEQSTYTVRVKNISSTRKTTDVHLALPFDTYFISASDNAARDSYNVTWKNVTLEPNQSRAFTTTVQIDHRTKDKMLIRARAYRGYWDGSNVRWLVLQIAPKDTRTLTYSVRVRADAPLRSVLTASATADGSLSRDRTTVVLQSTENGLIPNEILFRKTSDRREAVPGGRIRYTLFIKNTLDHVISDASIVDRFENRYLSLDTYENPSSLISRTDSQMIWAVPVLKPGESWKTSYVLKVGENAPSGMDLDNVATLRGADVGGLSLTERVRTNQAGVLGEFPETGAGMDTILAGILALTALGATAIQKKLTLGKM